MVSTENTSELEIAGIDVPLLRVPHLLTYRSVQRIRIPKKDVFLKWQLPELLSAVSAETLSEIKTYWEERNTIDIERDHRFPVLNLCDRNLAHTLRWHLRGLPVLLAVRKVRTGIVNYLNANEVNEAKQRRLNQTIQGFRIGNRVVLSQQGYCRQEMIGWEGVIITVREDYCLVQFDLQPKEIDGGDKKYQLKYQWISMIRPESPQRKVTRIPPSPPVLKSAQLKAEIESSTKEVAKIKSEVKLPAQPSKADVNPEVKVKHTLQQLVKNLKLFAPTNLELSQENVGYTAIELAEKLNVSRAKIYQMRSNGTLEAAGYRAESQGRSLLFLKIN